MGSPNRHKYVLLVTAFILFIVFTFRPPTPKLGPPSGQRYREGQPQYLHESVFRAKVDYEYEFKLSKALRAIEIEGTQRHNEDATDTLWQIMLPGVDRRSEDSIQFEKKNPEWKYKVCQPEMAHLREFAVKSLT